jgi:hypothetical protein
MGIGPLPCFWHADAFEPIFGTENPFFPKARDTMSAMENNKTRSPLEDVLFSPHGPGETGGSFGTGPDANKVEIPVAELRRLANNHAGLIRPSIGKRTLRALIGFLISVAIGVAGAVTWQNHRDEANRAFRNWTAASLGWLSSTLSTAGPQPDPNVAAEKPVTTVSRQKAANETSAPALQTTPETVRGLVQQLDSIVQSLATLQQSVAELAAKQEQISLRMENLQSPDRQIKQKNPPSRKRVPIASRRPDAQSASPQELPAPPSSSRPPSSSIPRPPSVLGEDER